MFDVPDMLMPDFSGLGFDAEAHRPVDPPATPHLAMGRQPMAQPRPVRRRRPVVDQAPGGLMPLLVGWCRGHGERACWGG